MGNELVFYKKVLTAWVQCKIIKIVCASLL